ncbi:hypothetical protein E2C01_066539 [Portunus trituberculatus]|uniref:Uncharacterized protein n=1 Tax=Portunus trituberculatus TaxID=210409 RepID=A0A5B7HHD0_PORTR|nr:hypothetical protein [Portunus trituberculatus]
MPLRQQRLPPSTPHAAPSPQLSSGASRITGADLNLVKRRLKPITVALEGSNPLHPPWSHGGI